MPHSCPFSKLPLPDAAVPSFDDRIQRWLWQCHNRSVQCFAAVALTSCNLAHPVGMTFEVHKGNTIVRSVWTNSVRNAFRKQAGWAKLQEVRATEAKHWTDRVWYCHTQRWMRSSKERTEASRSGSFKNGQEWGKKCFDDLDQRRMGRPATRTWSTINEHISGVRTFSSEKDQVEKK